METMSAERGTMNGKAGSQKSEARSQKPEARSRRPEHRSQNESLSGPSHSGFRLLAPDSCFQFIVPRSDFLVQKT
jgi:hypothetical protein